MRDVRDPCRRKHGGDVESNAAFESRDRVRQREQVLHLIAARPEGATVDELAALLDVDSNAISGRFTELKTSGEIAWAGEKRRTRSGCLAKVFKRRGDVFPKAI